MSCANPTGRGSAVALTIPVDHIRFLRSVFQMARSGIKDELAEYPDTLREPTQLHREEAVYRRLLMALDELVVVPDRDLRTVLGDLVQIIDQDNEYERVISEHEALCGLLGQIQGPARRS
jgi:hypothetical protein